MCGAWIRRAQWQWATAGKWVIFFKARVSTVPMQSSKVKSTMMSWYSPPPPPRRKKKKEEKNEPLLMNKWNAWLLKWETGSKTKRTGCFHNCQSLLWSFCWHILWPLPCPPLPKPPFQMNRKFKFMYNKSQSSNSIQNGIYMYWKAYV